MNKNTSLVIWTVAGILLVLWVAGVVAQTTFGGALHVLLVLVVLAVILGIFRTRRV